MLRTYFLLYVATATLLFTLSGCETSVELDTPPFEKDLVLYAHIEAGKQTAHVYLSHTRSPGSNEVFIPIENAAFKLSKDGMPAESIVANIVYPQPGNYSLYEIKTGFIQPGSTYTIEVSTDGDYPDITTTTLIPHIQPNISFEYFSSSSNNEDTYRILLYDDSSADYYQFFLEAYDTTTTMPRQVIQFGIDAQSELTDFPVNDAANYPLKGGHLFDDKGYNGQEKEIFINIPKEQLNADDISRGTWKYELHVSKISEPFYLFNRIVAQQNGTFPIPIFGNPPTPYTNIQNGYGCFSAQYISRSVSTKFISE